MKIDLFYEFCQGTGRPWPAGADHHLYQQVLEQVDVGEAAGFNCFWSVEHHGSVEFAHMPAPEIFLTAVAARTKQMRVGHAVVLTHPLFNHPVRVAERAAVLDNLSDGRLEIGFGRSTVREWDVFHIDGETTRPILRETLEIIPRMWTEDEFSYSSEHVEIAPITVVPRVLQDPHPPMWIAGGSPESIELAGRGGIGYLGLTLFQPLAALAESVRAYREAQREQQPFGQAVNNRCGAFTYVYCAETEDEAIHDGGPQAAAWYLTKVAALRLGWKAQREGEESAAFDRAAQIERIAESGDSPGRTVLIKVLEGAEISNEEFFEAMDAEDQFIVGTPDQIIEKMERYRDVGLDHMMCLVQAGPSLPHEKIMKSLRLMGEAVIPHFHD